MEIENDRSAGGILRISDIGDAGQQTRLDLLLQPCGDIVITIRDINTGKRLSHTIYPISGGGRSPILTRGLQQIILKLAEGKK